MLSFYVKLDRLPAFDRWADALAPLANGAFFVTTGEVLLSGRRAAVIRQRHANGRIWRYTGPPCAGDSCPGWRELDNNPKTIRLAVGGFQ